MTSRHRSLARWGSTRQAVSPIVISRACCSIEAAVQLGLDDEDQVVPVPHHFVEHGAALRGPRLGLSDVGFQCGRSHRKPCGRLRGGRR